MLVPRFCNSIIAGDYILVLFKCGGKYELVINKNLQSDVRPIRFKIIIKDLDELDEELFTDILSDVMGSFFRKKDDKIWFFIKKHRYVELDFNTQQMLKGNVGLCI